jgi:uncharacterized protein
MEGLFCFQMITPLNLTPTWMLTVARRCAVLLIFFLFFLSAAAQRPVPAQRAWVQDEAQILSSQTIRQLEYTLQAHADSTSNQIAVYIIKSLQGEDVDDYAVRVFSKWNLGQK